MDLLDHHRDVMPYLWRAYEVTDTCAQYLAYVVEWFPHISWSQERLMTAWSAMDYMYGVFAIPSWDGNGN